MMPLPLWNISITPDICTVIVHVVLKSQALRAVVLASVCGAASSTPPTLTHPPVSSIVKSIVVSKNYMEGGGGGGKEEV